MPSRDNPKPTPDASARLNSGQRLRGVLVALVLAAVLVLDGLLLYLALAERRQAVAGAETTTLTLARLIESSFTLRLGNIERLFIGIDDVLQTVPDARLERNPEILQFLVRRLEKTTLSRGLTIIDRTGKTLYATHLDDPFKTFDMAERDYFRHYQGQAKPELFLSEPIQSKADMRWVMIAAWPLSYPDGRFRGLVTASIDLEQVAQSLGTFAARQPGLGVTVARLDGLVYANHPYHADLAGRSLANTPAYRAFRGQAEGSFSGVSPLDGQYRYVSFRVSAAQPFFVAVSLDDKPVLGPWRTRAGFFFGIGLAGTVLMIGLGLMLRRLLGSLAREIEQRRRQDFVQAAFEGLPGIFYLFDSKGRLKLWNRSFETATGFTADELARLHPGDLFRGNDVERVRTAIGQVLKSGFASVEADLVGKDGRLRPYVFTGRRFIDEGEAHVVGMGLDIADRKRAEAALKEKNEALARSNAELEQFASVASHDLREPLRTIISYLTLVERRLADRLDTESRGDIAFVRDAAHRMNQLVLDLLDYARVGHDPEPARPVDLAHVIEAVRNILRPAIEASGAVLALETPLPTLPGWPEDLTRLFQNLIDNAIKYRRNDLTPNIRIRATRLDAEWTIAVADNGIGIAAEHAERVFRIFQRLHARGAHGGGTGIGLAVCKKVVERHGGRIAVASAGPGQGTTFTVTLPAA
ncbi:MAG: PAS domain S-box protein [Rhodospirillales bacterium]|nr:PAS domain S-box protein [Rhodospirillales bacterium]